jgi:hypothetical protein
MCPVNLATGHAGWEYNKDLAPDAVDQIGQRIEGIINTRKLAENSLEDDKQAQRGVQSAVEAGKSGDKSKRVIDGNYTEKFSVALAGREVFLAVDENEDAPYLVCTASRDNPLGVTEYTDGKVSADYIEAMREFVDRVDTLLITLEQERAAFPTIQPTLTVADCVPGGIDKTLTGKVVVIKPDSLLPEYRTADHQLKIVQGGFGAEPNARGNAVFCKDLYSDKESRFERYDVAGVVDPAKLPQWAKDKLAYLEALKEPGVFEYGGYHFKPYRQFEKRDGVFYASGNAVDSIAVGVATYEWTNPAYSRAGFYAAYGGEADIFKCVESGELYIPCENELFQYNEPPVKVQTKDKTQAVPKKSAPPKPTKAVNKADERPQQKPSLLAVLEASIVEAAQLAERKGGNHTKKRGDMTVD